jgi:hypothetical protein
MGTDHDRPRSTPPADWGIVYAQLVRTAELLTEACVRIEQTDARVQNIDSTLDTLARETTEMATLVRGMAKPAEVVTFGGVVGRMLERAANTKAGAKVGTAFGVFLGAVLVALASGLYEVVMGTPLPLTGAWWTTMLGLR